jgi:hypothetical protein
MTKKVALFVLANIAFAILVTAIYAIGYEYDKAYKLYPEMKWLSYDLVMQVYGQRWVRVVKALIGFGVIIDVVVLLTWYRSRQRKQSNILDLQIII